MGIGIRVGREQRRNDERASSSEYKGLFCQTFQRYPNHSWRRVLDLISEGGQIAAVAALGNVLAFY
ncbi:MAG: hypothetical protein Q4G30_02485 [Actinomycetaceae bacterium]|nr:hypothetical protein [Actinomycetaceae bacterium]